MLLVGKFEDDDEEEEDDDEWFAMFGEDMFVFSNEAIEFKCVFELIEELSVERAVAAVDDGSLVAFLFVLNV